MKKSIIPLAVITALMSAFLTPIQSQAMTSAEIEQELSAIKKLEQQAAWNRNNAETKKKEVARQKVKETRTIQDLLRQIDEQGEKLAELNTKISETTTSLKEAGTQLEEAQERMNARDQLLKSRVRLMYTNGFVSYIEVLLSSTSFTDFLDRYHALKSIVSQDKNILEANKQDRDLVAEKKKQIEGQLAEVQSLYAQSEEMKNKLIVQEKEKEKAVQILSRKEQQFEEVSEEQEKLLAQLAKKKSELYRKKQQLSQYSGGKLNWPLPGKTYITSGFGYRVDPINKSDANHKGIDIGAPQGTTIVAAEDGVVIVAQYVNGYGNTVVIDHGGGLWTWYAHIRHNGIKVSEGDTVKRGNKIAEVGSTGRSTGPHLHFEVRKNEVPVNPMSYLK